jgi:hypothetical protein
MTHRSCALLCLAFSTLPAQAQHTVASYSVTVELRMPPEQADTQLRGELASTTSASPALQSWISSGKMNFTDVPAGSYQLSVVNARGTVLKTLFIQSTADRSPVVVDLTSLSSPSYHGPAGSSISVHALLHRPPPNAVRLLLEARQFHGEQAVELLRRALAEDSQFFEAHISLGAELLQLKQAAASAAEFEKAAEERPDSASAFTDLAAAYISLRRPADAEGAARRATAIDSTLPQAHFLLAEALIGQVLVSSNEGKRQEAAGHLRLVADKIPQAKALLDWTANSLQR